VNAAIRSDDTGREPDRAGGDNTGDVAVADDPVVADFVVADFEPERLGAFFLVADVVVWAMWCSFELAGNVVVPTALGAGDQASNTDRLPRWLSIQTTPRAFDPAPTRVSRLLSMVPTGTEEEWVWDRE
jgi:hypothetical protein